MLYGDELPLSSLIELILRLSELSLYTIRICVEEPIAVNTVSKAMVSVESRMFFEGLSEKTCFLRHDTVKTIIDNNMIVKYLRIFT